jgi:adhesin/invasin
MPGYNFDYITIVSATALDNMHGQYFYTYMAKSGTLTFDALPAGNYEVRAHFNGDDSKVYARLPFTIVNPAPKFTLDKSSYVALEPMVVSYSDMPGYNFDYITIVSATALDSTHGQYFYTYTAKSGTMTFDPLPAGNYEVRAHFNNDDVKVYARAPFTIRNPTPNLTTTQPSYLALQPIVVNYSNMPGFSFDYLALVPATASDATDGQYFYTHGAKSGTMTFDPPVPGKYEIRAKFNNDSNKVYARVPVPINFPVPTLTLDKSTYHSKETYAVTYGNMSGYPRDYITVVPASALDGTDGQYFYTNGQIGATMIFSALTAGTYEARAKFNNDSTKVYARAAFTVSDANLTPTSTSLTVKPNPPIQNQPVVLTATVTPSGTGGNVSFRDGPTNLGSSALVGGVTSLTVGSLSVDSHSLTAFYQGDATHAPSTSAPVTLAPGGINAVSPCAPSFAYVSGLPLPSPVTCAFTSTASATFTVTTTSSWLQVTPTSGSLSSAPTSFSISVNPAGLSTGNYSGSFTIAGAQIGSMTSPVQLSITSPGTLVASPSMLSFKYEAGSAVPPPQSLTIASTNGTQLPFAVAASGGSWLIPGINSGTSPAPFNVIINPSGLAPGAYMGDLTISTPGVSSVGVKVSLLVDSAQPPLLSVNTTALNVSGLQGGPPVTVNVQLANNGGGVLNFTASVDGGDWLTVSPATGAIDSTAGNAATSLTITADPKALSPGTYQGSVTVTGADSTVKIPVSFSVGTPGSVILVSQAGLSFTAASHGGSPLPQQIGILNTGTGTLDWTATAKTLSGGNWLQLSSGLGTVQRPFSDVSPITLSIDPAVMNTLAPGDYYGQIQITAPAVNSPQSVTVILSVLAPGADPGPEVRPTSLIFTGPPDKSPPPQSVTVGIRKSATDQYISGHIGNGFSYTPSSSIVMPNQPVNVQVTPNFAALSPGQIDRGTITLQFSDGTAQTVGVLSVVAPPLTSSGRIGTLAGSCNKPNLEVQFRSPTQNFSAVRGQPTTIEAQIIDDCGNLIGPTNPQSATVNAVFSNKDADIRLTHIGNGIWTGTWRPVNASSGPVTIALTAFYSTGNVLQSGQQSESGSLSTGVTPTVTSGGVVHAASDAAGVPIAPGGLITIYGSNLADDTEQSSVLPLPQQQSGTQVLLGNLPLPILYTSNGQVNVQVPFSTPVNTQYQISVQRDNLLSVPEQLVIAAGQPGVFTVNQQGTGQGVIFKSDGVTLAQPGQPATAGETVVIYCTGLGAVSPPVPEGTPAPSLPLSNTVNPVTVTIGGQDAPVQFSGLTPGFPGLYQVNAVVPDGLSGDQIPVIVTVAGQSSPPVTIAVQ